MDPVKKRGRGRPPGSPNKPKPADIVIPTHAPSAMADYKHADPDSLVSRMLTLLDMQLTAAKSELDLSFKTADGKPRFYNAEFGKNLVDLANALVRAIDALKKSSDINEELSKRLSPQQLLEIALRKVEGQDEATLNYAIKRLRAYREKEFGSATPRAKVQLGEMKNFSNTAVDALASLEDEDD